MTPNTTRRLAAAALALSLAVCLAGAAGASSPQTSGVLSFSQPTFTVGEAAGPASITLRRAGGSEGALAARIDLAHVTTSAEDFAYRPGALDATFAQTDVFSISEKQQVALQPDGKVLVGGANFIDRRNADGTDDASFNPGALNGAVISIAVLPNGKILIGGPFTTINSVSANRMARLNADGSHDTSFNVGTGPSDWVKAIAVQTDGKILIGGDFSSVDGQHRPRLARLEANGALDLSYVPEGGSTVNSIVLQPDGKALVGGFISDKGVKRFNPDGSLDPTFLRMSGASNVSAVALQPDGKVLIGGFFDHVDGVPSPKVARLNSDGSLDSGFSSNVGPGADNTVRSIVLQPDGKVVLGGYFKAFNNLPAINLVRLNPDGGFDPTFFSDIQNFPGDRVETVVQQPDGRLLVGGFFVIRSPTSLRQKLARVHGDLFARWADGDAADKTVTLPVTNDALDETDETLSLSLVPLDGAAAGGPAEATLTVVDNDDAPAFTSAPPAPGITRTPYMHTFTATGAPAPTFTVTAGALPPGYSLNPTTGVLTGTTAVAGSFPVTVTAANGVAPAASQTFTLTVLSGGLIQFGSPTFSVREDGATATVTVTRTGGSAGTSEVIYSASGGSATGGGVDYTLTPGTLTFGDGVTSKTIEVQITNDAVNETDESVTIRLGVVTGSGALGTPSSAQLVITNDDPLPTISVADVTLVEGDTGTKVALFTVTRTGLIDRSLSFTATTVAGTARPGEDYIHLVTVTALDPSGTTTTVPVSILGDTITEPDESFTLVLSEPRNATIARAEAVCEVKNNETANNPPTVQYAARVFDTPEGSGLASVTVTRSGDLSAPTSVSYTTGFIPGGGNASDRSDYAPAFGTLSFAAGESSKTFHVFVTDDAHVENDEFIQVSLSNATGGAALGVPAVSVIRIADDDPAPSAANPADGSAFFVRQHYRDFLGRDPDEAGLAFWVDNIESCGADLQCRDVKRVNVSAAFFLSIEFQETGYLVYRLHKAAFNAGERLPLRTFLGDTQEIGRGVVVGEPGWELKLEQNKRAFLDAFVQRAAFTAQLPATLTPAQYVDALNANTGDPLNPSAGGSLTPAERDQLVADLAGGAKTRAEVLRAVAENAEFRRRLFNKAFVLMQYFGYLRRAPNSTPDTNFDGYNFWLQKLEQFDGNFVNAEMVRAFIESIEYRQRFGQ